MADIRQWLIGLELSEYAERFEAEKVDLDVAIALTEKDLEKLGVPIGAAQEATLGYRSPAGHETHTPCRRPNPIFKRNACTPLCRS